MQYKITHSKEYKKDIRKLNHQRLESLEIVINKLAKGETLESNYKDHKLTGNLKNYRECHIKPDLLLIYAIYEDILELNVLRVGSHSDLFE